MAFADSPHQDSIQLLQRSLSDGRVAHAYLFSGNSLDQLELVARSLAQTLNCLAPTQASGDPDACGHCANCLRIGSSAHPDVQWVRPESKSRIITIDQMRELMKTIHLKAGDAVYKVGIIVAADRLNPQAANAFLKTLEEPPPRSIFILLTTDPGRVLETIESRCLRLNFGGEAAHWTDPEFLEWMGAFTEAAVTEQGTILSRYRLLSVVLTRLTVLKEQLTERLSARSPLEQFDEIESKLRERWEEELVAAVEAEYRRQRAELLTGIHWWLRDIWLERLGQSDGLAAFPRFQIAARAIAERLTEAEARENLVTVERIQRQLGSNVQEALTLEVGMLRLKL